MKAGYKKWAVTVACVLAAGICYSCGGKAGRGGAESRTMIISEGSAFSGGESADGSFARSEGGAGGAESAGAGEGGTGVPVEGGTSGVTGSRMPGDGEIAESGGAETGLPAGTGFSGEVGIGLPAGADVSGKAESGAAGEDVSGASETLSSMCYVHICGEVLHPGVYQLEAGSRIFQAVEMAGGFTENAAASYLNLAGEIADGMQIIVPSVSEAESMERVPAGISVAEGNGRPASSGGSSVSAEYPAGSGGSDHAKVNLNTADKAQLMTLRGIGEARAEDIIRYREEHGPFRRIEDIMNVSGIKKAAFEKMKDDITV